MNGSGDAQRTSRSRPDPTESGVAALPRQTPGIGAATTPRVFSTSVHSTTMDPLPGCHGVEPGWRVSITCRVIESPWHDGEHGREGTPWTWQPSEREQPI
jgi:hypothetical protein